MTLRASRYACQDKGKAKDTFRVNRQRSDILVVYAAPREEQLNGARYDSRAARKEEGRLISNQVAQAESSLQ